jgi:hypothetical protein
MENIKVAKKMATLAYFFTLFCGICYFLSLTAQDRVDYFLGSCFKTEIIDTSSTERAALHQAIDSLLTHQRESNDICEYEYDSEFGRLKIRHLRSEQVWEINLTRDDGSATSVIRRGDLLPSLDSISDRITKDFDEQCAKLRINQRDSSPLQIFEDGRRKILWSDATVPQVPLLPMKYDAAVLVLGILYLISIVTCFSRLNRLINNVPLPKEPAWMAIDGDTMFELVATIVWLAAFIAAGLLVGQWCWIKSNAVVNSLLKEGYHVISWHITFWTFASIGLLIGTFYFPIRICGYLILLRIRYFTPR